MPYISPEAIEGEVVDNRSDIYSLGCTAFHLLTGQPPFTGTSIASTMSAHLRKPVPSISTINEHLPERMDAVFERVLAKNPNDRYQSCAEFVAALQEAAGAGEVRYPASAPTLAAAKRRAVDPGAPTQLRNGANHPEPPPRRPQTKAQRQTRKSAVTPRQPVTRTRARLNAFIALAAVLGVPVVLSWMTSGKDSTPPSPRTTSSLPPAPPPPVVTTTSAVTVPVPTQTRTVTSTVAVTPAPYVGMPCTWAERNQESADGTLICGGGGSWQEVIVPGPGVQQGTLCTVPGTRAWAAGTDRNVTCMAGPDGSLRWFFT